MLCTLAKARQGALWANLNHVSLLIVRTLMLGPVVMDTSVQQSLKDACKRKRQDNAALPL